MSYKEPYPVTVTYPPTGITGNKACFHYTQTYSQVCTICDELHQSIDTVKDITVFPNIVKIPSRIAGLIDGIATVGKTPFKFSPYVVMASLCIEAFELPTDISKMTAVSTLETYYNVYVEVRNFMRKNNFKRVTFSQLLEYRRSKISGDYIMGWYCIGKPRVPHISYYYKK